MIITAPGHWVPLATSSAVRPALEGAGRRFLRRAWTARGNGGTGVTGGDLYVAVF